LGIISTSKYSLNNSYVLAHNLQKNSLSNSFDNTRLELYYSEACASGCQSDISRAYNEIRTAISESGTCGLGMIDVATQRFPDTSENMNSRNEAVVHAELERYILKARDILLKNREFLEKATDMLLAKETLLYSDVKAMRESVSIVEVAV